MLNKYISTESTQYYCTVLVEIQVMVMQTAQNIIFKKHILHDKNNLYLVRLTLENTFRQLDIEFLKTRNVVTYPLPH